MKKSKVYKELYEKFLEDTDEILDIFFCGDIEKFLKCKEDILIHPYISLREMGMDYVNSGFLGEISDSLYYFIDFEQLANEIIMAGNFLIGRYIYELIN